MRFLGVPLDTVNGSVLVYILANCMQCSKLFGILNTQVSSYLYGFTLFSKRLRQSWHNGSAVVTLFNVVGNLGLSFSFVECPSHIGI